MEQTIFRDQNGNLWLLRGTNLIPVDVNNPEMIRMMQSSNLYNTGLNMTPDEAKKFIFVIVNDKPEELNQWFTTNPKQVFYKPTTQVDINPILALRILKQFGFRLYQDVNGLRRIESVDHWLQNFMAQNFQNPYVQNMILNPSTGVLAYLHNLVNLINSNPAILNRVNNIGEAQRIIVFRKERTP